MKRKPKGYWTKERCAEDALRFKTRTEWRNHSKGSYIFAFKQGWLNDCCQHMEILGSNYRRLIYAFEFPDNHVYVGLTFNINKRREKHLIEGSPVYAHFKKTGNEPILKILTDFMLKEIIGVKECEFILKYRTEGWILLNRKKGGGLGGGERRWNKLNCIEDAKKYKSNSEWIKKSNSAYQTALRNGWLDECYSNLSLSRKKKNYWTLERCLEETSNIFSVKEWKKISPKSYYTAINKGWYEECSKHMKKSKNANNYWNLELCKVEAKKFKSIYEWSRKSGSSYNAARKNGWVNLCFNRNCI